MRKNRVLSALFVLSLMGACHGAPPLEVGPSAEHALRAGERRDHRLPMVRGDFVKIEVVELGLDIALSLLSPRGEELTKVNLRRSRPGTEPFFWVATEGGIHQLGVQEVAGVSGSYRIEVLALHPASEAERAQSLGENLFARANLLSNDVATQSKLEAIDLYRQSMPAFEHIGDELSIASAWHNIGSARNRLGQPERAIEAFQEALDIWQREKRSRETAETRLMLGTALSNASRFADARVHLELARDAFAELGPPSKQASAMTRLAGAYHGAGEASEAIELYHESIDLWQTSSHLVGLGNAQSQLAALQQDLGNFHQSLSLYQTAIENLREAGTGGTEAEALSAAMINLGRLYRYLGRADEAVDIYDRAVILLREIGQERGEAMTWINLGRAQELSGDPLAAEESYRRSIRLLGALGDVRSEAIAKVNLARALTTLERFDEAFALLREVRGTQSQHGLPDLETATFETEALIHQALDHHEMALAKLYQAERLTREKARLAPLAGILRHIALSERALGRLETALRYQREAVDITESLRGNVLADDLRTSYLATERRQYELLVSLLVELDERNPGHGFLAGALEASESSHARGLGDLLVEARRQARQGIAPGLRAREEQARLAIARVQRRLEVTVDDALRAKLHTELTSATRMLDEVERRIRGTHARYSELRYPSPLDTAAVRRLLPPRTALLEYLTGEESSYLFVLTDQSLAAYALPPASDLARDAHELVRLMTPKRRRASEIAAAAGQLYERLIAPAEGHLGHVDQLLIVPDGPLSSLAFESLVADAHEEISGFADVDYLLERWQVSYLPSATVLSNLPRQEGPWALDLAAFAAPANPPGRLPRLDHSESEVRSIAALFDAARCRIAMEEDAIESKIKQQDLAEARYLHFATHGSIHTDSPHLSALVVGRGTPSQEDGLLQVFEIFDLELKADLVTLSACDTGRGQAVVGEGLLGLGRAFFYAGAESLVVSLWQVEDRTTAAFMAHFYRHLAAGNSKAAALHLAKLEQLARNPDPYYWAPFVLLGRP